MDINKWSKVETQVFHCIGHALTVAPYGRNIDHSSGKWYLRQSFAHELLNQRGLGRKRVIPRHGCLKALIEEMFPCDVPQTAFIYPSI